MNRVEDFQNLILTYLYLLGSDLIPNYFTHLNHLIIAKLLFVISIINYLAQ
jgi:hypothetical protein